MFNRKGYFYFKKGKKGLKGHQERFIKFKSLNECPLNLSWTITFNVEKEKGSFSHALRLNLIFNFMPLKGIAYEMVKNTKGKVEMMMNKHLMIISIVLLFIQH